MEDAAGADRLKNSLLGLLPENWRMWLIVGVIGYVVITNPQAAWFVGGKLFSGISGILGKLGSIDLGGLTPNAPQPLAPNATGIDAPLQAAQTQIAWAVKNNNAAVLEAGVNSLKALVNVTAPALFLLACLAGCSAGESARTVKPDCEYSESHSFGYVQPPPAEQHRMYTEEPTLFQQEPELAK